MRRTWRHSSADDDWAGCIGCVVAGLIYLVFIGAAAFVLMWAVLLALHLAGVIT